MNKRTITEHLKQINQNAQANGDNVASLAYRLSNKGNEFFLSISILSLTRKDDSKISTNENQTFVYDFESPENVIWDFDNSQTFLSLKV